MMPIGFTGKEARLPEGGVSLQAHDANGAVRVTTSDEALNDYGLMAVQDRASEKYDAKQFEEDGSIRVVTSDFL